jgi:hypothetical protein
MAADKGEVFVFQKITSVWLTGNGRDKRVALEIRFKCYLGDERQTSPQAWPALPQWESRFYHVYAGNGRAGSLTFSN